MIKTFGLWLLAFLAMKYSQTVQAQEKVGINTKDISIIRDAYGVPHIYGKTDADAAYGLVWAQCEDDFENIQLVYAGLRGKAGEHWGKMGAGYDFIIYAANFDPIIEEQFDSAFSPEFHKILTASVQAVNDYAALYPEELLIKKGVFPVTEKDIVKAYLFGGLIMSNAVFDMGNAMQNKLKAAATEMGATGGSNAFAFSKKKTGENTWMISNSHQPLEGPFAWYEAHVVSEEGWNMMGAKFTTGVSLFVGTNENLGWTHTVNYPDLSDVYLLEMHPKKKNHYLFDGEYLPLEERKKKIKVKVGPIKIPVSKKFYVSNYGPTIKTKNGYFAFRMPSSMRINSAEQWFHMNKAKNLKEFKQALEIQGIASLNVIYADKEDNILLLSNALIPKGRKDSYDWKNVLKGTSSDNLWEDDFYSIYDLPYYENPESGYLFNMNNTPYSATDDKENFLLEDAPPHAGFLVGETNRALRFQELSDGLEQIYYEDFKEMKFDVQYFSETFYTWGLSNFDDLFKLRAQDYPSLGKSIEILQNWDKRSNIENRNAALPSVCLSYLLLNIQERGDLANSTTFTQEEIVDALRKAQKFLLKHYGRLDVPAGELHRHRRGDVDLPSEGMPENLAAMTYTFDKKGKLKTFHGESFIQFVQYDENGVVLIESITPFGSSNNPESRHYTDQMEAYVNRDLKKMTLDKKTILENAVLSYHPGEINYRERTAVKK